MAFETRKIIYAQRQLASFETVLDDACKILEDKQIQYHIRRLNELEVYLGDMEKELDLIIETGNSAKQELTAPQPESTTPP